MEPDEAPDRKRRASPVAWTVIGDLPCVVCHYNLRSMVGPELVCPECGVSMDLRDGSLWDGHALTVPSRAHTRWPIEAAIAGSAWFLTLVFAVGAIAAWSIISVPGVFATLVSVVMLAIWLLSIRGWLRTCTRPARARRILVMTHLSIVCGMTMITTGSFMFIAIMRTGSTVSAGLLVITLASGLASLASLAAAAAMIHRGASDGLFRDPGDATHLPVHREPIAPPSAPTVSSRADVRHGHANAGESERLVMQEGDDLDHIRSLG